LPSQSGKTARKMVSQRRGRDPDDLGSRFERPPMPMDKHHGETLMIRQRRKSGGKTRLNVGQLLRRGLRERDPTTQAAMPTRCRLSNSIEVPGRIRHLREPFTVLPGVRHNVAPDLDATLPPVAGDEDLAQPLFSLGAKRAEFGFDTSTLVGCRYPHTQRDP
jgi:hypothetical protein